jgi:hypothetical protein
VPENGQKLGILWVGEMTGNQWEPWCERTKAPFIFGCSVATFEKTWLF